MVRFCGRRLGVERGTSQLSQPVRQRGGKKSLNRILERLNPPLSALDSNDFFFSSFRSQPFVTHRPDNNQSVAQNIERVGELFCVGVCAIIVYNNQATLFFCLCVDLWARVKRVSPSSGLSGPL